MKQIEILAPAGSFEGMTAAIHASCDAVYIGGNKFGARAYADNPVEDDMLRAIDYAHIHDKKIYMTVNTLLKNSELENELYEYMLRYYEQGLDAVIVQDIGVLHFIHEHFPALAIHASTQMTLTMAQGANVLKPMGITRLVNSRELGLEEIKTIKANSDLEIESFVHGALCYCYSGQCFMSSLFGGRSGNRGRCAQPCRMPYELKADGRVLNNTEEKYLLSPKDICTIDMIPDLIDAGIDSFKIEGRMKRPEYAAGVTYLYRKYVDLYLELGQERYEAFMSDHKADLRADMLSLQDLYNRGGFSQGYYTSRNGKAMMSVVRPNHSGVVVGEVKTAKENQVQIRLLEDLNPQDILEIRGTSESLYEFTVKNVQNKGSKYTININKGSKVRPGNMVYRTKNNLLLEQLGERFLKVESKEPVKGELTVNIGQNLGLVLSCRDIFVSVEGGIVEEAKNQPMNEDKIRKQMEKTKETSFVFEELVIHINGNVFIPVQKLNELRRDGLNALADAITESYRRKTPKESENTNNRPENSLKLPPADKILDKPEIVAEIATKQQLKAACSQAEVASIYLDSDIVPLTELLSLTQYGKQSNKKVYIVFPQIFRYTTYQFFLQHKKLLLDNTIDGYIIQNFEEYEFVNHELNYRSVGKELIINYNLYVMNRHAMAFWQEQGVTRFTAPIELNYHELKELTGCYQDIIVYGKLPLMVSAQCLVKTALGENSKNNYKISESPCCGREIDQIELIDRYHKNLPVKRHCRDCYNTIYNCQSLSLLADYVEVKRLKPENIRLNFTFESAEETTRIIHAFVQSYQYDKQPVIDSKEYTRGHFKRGVE